MNIPEKPDNILLQIEDASRASVVLMDMTYFFDEGKLKRKIYIINHRDGTPGGRRGNFVTKIQTFRGMYVCFPLLILRSKMFPTH